MGIGERLKTLRLKMKKTLKEQSEALGVSINTIYRWEKNITVPRRQKLIELAEFYNQPLDWLIFGDTAEETPQDEKNVQTETTVERQLLEIFAKLSDSNKYRVLGYIERMGIEDIL